MPRRQFPALDQILNPHTDASCRPTEVYSFGSPSAMGRRDQREGQQTAVVTTTDDSVQVSVTWGDPNPGEWCM